MEPTITGAIQHKWGVLKEGAKQMWRSGPIQPYTSGPIKRTGLAIERSGPLVIGRANRKISITPTAPGGQPDREFIKRLKVESFYYDDLMKKYGTNRAQNQQIMNIKRDVESSNTENTYDVYISISLDTDRYAFTYNAGAGQPGQPAQPVTSNPIIWKWGSEKRYFDYLNVLVDTIETDVGNKEGKVTLERKIKDYGEMGVLGRLWEKYRDRDDNVPSKNANTDPLRSEILKKNFNRAKKTILISSANAVAPTAGQQPYPQSASLTTIQDNEGATQLVAAMNAVRAYYNNDLVIAPANRNKQNILDEIVPKITAMAIEAGVYGYSAGGANANSASKLEVAIAVLLAYATPGNGSIAGTADNCTAKSILRAAKIAFEPNGAGGAGGNDSRIIHLASAAVTGNDADRKTRAVFRTEAGAAGAIQTDFTGRTPPILTDERNFAGGIFRGFYEADNIALKNNLNGNASEIGGAACRALIEVATRVQANRAQTAMNARLLMDMTANVVFGNGNDAQNNSNALWQSSFDTPAGQTSSLITGDALAAGNVPNHIFDNYIYTNMVDFTGIPNIGADAHAVREQLVGNRAQDTNKIKSDILKRIMDVRARLRIVKSLNENIPVVVYGTGANGADARTFYNNKSTNIIFTDAGVRYAVSLLDFFLAPYENNFLKPNATGNIITPRDYLIAFMWNAYDPGIDRSLKKSFRLMRLAPSNNFYGNTEQTEKILYFRELRDLFTRFMDSNKPYLAGQQNDIVYNNQIIPHTGAHANRRNYQNLVEDAKSKTERGRKAIREYFLNRFGNGERFNNVQYEIGGIDGTNPLVAIVPVPGQVGFTPIFGEAPPAGAPDNRRNPFYQTQNEFLVSLSKLSKAERDIVVRLFEMGQLQQQQPVKVLKIDVKGTKIYPRFMDICTLVYIFRHKNDAGVKNALGDYRGENHGLRLINQMKNPADIVRIPEKPAGVAQDPNNNALYYITPQTGGSKSRKSSSKKKSSEKKKSSSSSSLKKKSSEKKKSSSTKKKSSTKKRS